MQKIVVGNWKMHGHPDAARTLVQAVVGRSGQSDVVICPPFTLLPLVAELLSGAWVRLGAQDCSPQPQGAFTGDISADMLKDIGCTYVIVGHSERRQHHGENDSQVRLKAEAAQAQGLIPIICVGETLAERKAGQAEAVVKTQLKGAIPPSGQFLLAYEPVWAIGSGETAQADDIRQMHCYIASVVGNAVPVLYGGSVKAANAREIMATEGVAGVLVGGASLDAGAFGTIIDAADAA